MGKFSSPLLHSAICNNTIDVAHLTTGPCGADLDAFTVNLRSGFMPGRASELRRLARTSNARGSRGWSTCRFWRCQLTAIIDPGADVACNNPRLRERHVCQVGNPGCSRTRSENPFWPSCKTKDALRYWVSSKQRAREWKGGGQRRL